MDEIVEKHLDKMLEVYTNNEFWDTLINAKKMYTQLTGTLIDEDQAFETRMNNFNDWYLFNYSAKDDLPFSKIYTSSNELAEDIDLALNSVMYSLFEYSKDNMRGHVVLKDILHNKKFILKEKSVGVIEGDIFTGRLLCYQGEFYLLKGMCIVPSSVRNLLRKYSGKIRKLRNLEEEYAFLYKIESLSTRAGLYNHVDPSKIFVLD